MRSVPIFSIAALTLALAACTDDPLKSGLPETPPPAAQGVQAFVQVDNAQAQPGSQVHVFVRVQLGSESDAKLGSYTGRLTFDPEVLAYSGEVKINDGLRVTNPNGAAGGEVRFAGASAAGFADLTLYEAIFEVKGSGYVNALKLKIEELSAAGTLTHLEETLDVPQQVFARKAGS